MALLITVPLARVSQQVYAMGRAMGMSKEEGSSVVKVYEPFTGVTVRGGKQARPSRSVLPLRPTRRSFVRG